MDQRVIEHGKRQPRNKRVDPDRKPGELHGKSVQIDPVDAPPGYHPPQELTILDDSGIRKFVECRHRGIPQHGQFRADTRQWPPGEIVRHTLLDPVDRRDQEVTRAHGDIGDTKIEELLGSICGIKGGKAFKMIPQRGLESAIQQVLHRKVLGVVAARRLPLPGTVMEIDGALPDRHHGVLAGRQIVPLRVHREVGLGDGKLRFEKPLVNRAEFTTRSGTGSRRDPVRRRRPR